MVVEKSYKSKNYDEKYCSSCGETIKKDAEICPKCGVRVSNSKVEQEYYEKNKIAAGLLAILLGIFGAHKFYLGFTAIGVIYLCFFWTGIPAILGLIEGIIYLSTSDEAFQKIYVEGKREFF